MCSDVAVQHVVYPKSEEARAFILSVVGDSTLFAGANAAQRTQLVDAMKEINTEAGDMIIKQVAAARMPPVSPHTTRWRASCRPRLALTVAGLT